ncbi:Sir2 family NAD-dependent protein deacetylase [Methanosphaera sp. BMS]|uniref:SIR2 family NAD-dependent protein deacylase n=1 Tax=Methanosphaera sp. BMS TaxID=1789762 RepID=UPI000DD46DFA|nr:Sir2 family NAD-dependent protein deacetylase [Methanosphaera sp. BMS]
MKDTSENIGRLKEVFDNTDNILIGAGAGLSTASGIEYSGRRFEDNFRDFIKKYDFTDMYTSGFYPFETEEEKWAYWSKHIYLNNVGMSATPLYEKIHELVKDKNYFVITTNVDDQFYKASFDSARIFRMQGSYRYIQCQKACHDKLYDNTQLVKEMIDSIDDDLRIASELVPKCPVCGGPMDTNLRKDNYFVEDEYWHAQKDAYVNYLNSVKNENTLLLEFGVGFNTPSIIRFPFEEMAFNNDKWTLARINKDHLELMVKLKYNYKLLTVEDLDEMGLKSIFLDRYIPLNDDVELVIDELLK